MKISYEWLQQYVEYTDGPEKLGEIFTQVGFPVEDIQQVGDDWMLDVEVTSNRADCLGHIGLAREVAAVTGAKLTIPSVDFNESGKDVSSLTHVENQSDELCRRYTARLIEDVKVGSAPDWMVKRLETLGMRSVNNVVDITNYVLMEIGQPLHTFDFDKLEDKKIVIRLAQKGEKMVSIDQSNLTLTEKMLVIADGKNPVALAGVMGGLDSEVSDQTSNILLESAWFDPLTVRNASRQLTLASESSYRFERNVSQVLVEWGSRRAASLLAELAGGSVASGFIDVWKSTHQEQTVDLRLARLKKVLGIEIDPKRVMQIFEVLGFEPNLDDQQVIRCKVPVWRNDITMEADLIEEVIRIHGFEHIPTEESIHIKVKREDDFQKTRLKVTNAIKGCGFFETINVSFIEDKFWPLFSEKGFDPVRVNEFTRKVDNALRQSLLPSILKVRKHNQDAGNLNCHFYELAATHRRDGKGTKVNEIISLGCCSDHGLRELRGVIEAVVKKCNGQASVTFQPADVVWAKEGCGANILVNGQVVGQAGQASEKVLSTFDLEKPVSLAEIQFNHLIELVKSAIATLTPLMKFPGITRDLSLVLDDNVAWADIAETIQSQSIDEMQSVDFVDIYRGKGVDKGKKSLTLSMHFRNPNETMTHQQVDGFQEKIVAVLAQKFQAQLRA